MSPGVIGRDSELAALQAFLDAMAAGPTAFVLRGEPGIGKTALWEAGIAAAHERGFEVLVARPSQAEAQLSFAALNDLLERVDDSTLGTLPVPQRRALEIALLRVDPSGVPPEPRAIAAGFLHVLRTLSARNRVLVAIDDVQWLDAASLDVVTFGARRLRDEPVRFLLSERLGSAFALRRALDKMELASTELGALSFGAARRLLADRLNLVLSRRAMRRTFEATRGNPLFVLEVGRMLGQRGGSIEDDLSLPPMVEDLLGVRVAGLPAPVRRLLLAVALSADLHESQLAGIADPAVIDAARDAELLVFDGDRLRPSHPLLAEAARTQARVSERIALHRELAKVVTDEAVRARHLALAATEPDESLAASLAAAADLAAARGERRDAAELAGQALRLTPRDSAHRVDRLLAYAEHLYGVAEFDRLQALLKPELDHLPAGVARARAHRVLIHGTASILEYEQHLELALAESGDDPGMRASALAEKVFFAVNSLDARLRDAEAWALEALSLDRAWLPALGALGWVRILRGMPIEDLLERQHEMADTLSPVIESMHRLAGIRCAFRGEVVAARRTFAQLLALADDRGEAWSHGALYAQLSEVELRAGDCVATQQLLDEWDVPHESTVETLAVLARLTALLAVHRGLPDAADEWATNAISIAETSRSAWDLLEAKRARGIAALFAGHPDRAVDDLLAVWEHTQREGVEDPGAFPAAPDLVEALVALGRIDEAAVVTGRLGYLAEDQAHPWGLATVKRCRALVLLASDPSDAAAFTALTEAASAYGDLGLTFDHARSLLILGRSQRRARRWGDARRSLEQALAAFDAIGSTGWADQTRSEVDRVGARRPAAAGTLTPAEGRVVELAAEGRSNKEIAHTLSIGVHTVEVQLSRAYAKLGVQSRAQLVRRLADGPTP